MKAIFWSLAVLVLAAAFCFGFGFWVSSALGDVAQKANQSLSLLEDGREDGVLELLESAESRWNELEMLLAATTPHDELTYVHVGLERLKAILETQGDLDTAITELRELALRLEELRRRELPLPENIF